ncbi:MAG: hypothetical protein LBP26_04530 [Clostridiales bacterium]|jgi:uncharacterized membrane protein YcgQ (UPF0703/DUF1980 family)|nr:hypothetical protein [Clostridiales bacterium]
MKRIIAAIVICVLCAFALVGCRSPRIIGDTVEIGEDMFIAQINDIYLNQKDYLGKTIKFEGMFTQYTWEAENKTYYMVYRRSPGCCGNDGQAGFEVVWPPDAETALYPAENDWCLVEGALATYVEGSQAYLHIVLTALTVKPDRGAEFVER